MNSLPIEGMGRIPHHIFLIAGLFTILRGRPFFTAQAVVLEQASEHAIVVADFSGVRTTIRTNVNISELVQEGEHYFITYTTRLWRPPELQSIKKIDAW